MKRTKEEVNFREQTVEGERCGTCVHVFPHGAHQYACHAVSTMTDPVHVCDLWERPDKTQ